MYVPHHTPHSRFVQEGRPLRYPFWRGGKSDVPKVVIDVSLAFSLVEIKIYTVLCRKLRVSQHINRGVLSNFSSSEHFINWTKSCKIITVKPSLCRIEHWQHFRNCTLSTVHGEIDQQRCSINHITYGWCRKNTRPGGMEIALTPKQDNETLYVL